MKAFFLQQFRNILCITVLSLAVFLPGCKPSKLTANRQHEENDKYDGPGLAAQFEFDRTKDPATGTIPAGKYWEAVQQTIQSKNASSFGPSGTSSFGASWVERGPNTDFTGPSNGNTRANSGITSGRVRAMLVDAADATKKTVWIGGVAGGLWKTTDITVAAPTWTIVNDYLTNMAIADIVQQPGNPNVMYFCTGEGYFNIDWIAGNGVFKSTDHGVTWTQLSSTAGWSANRILVDAAGNIYVGTATTVAFSGIGVQRSADGGLTWSTITPTGSSTRIADMELSSSGRLHITTGLNNQTTGMYRYTDNPATVTSGTWTASATAFPYPSGANCRVELGCNGNVLYALPSNTSAQVATIYKSTDGGANWAATGSQPTAGWASGQAWYALAVDIDPSDPTNSCIVGGLDTWKTTNGGVTWTQISTWVGTTPVNQYVHADVQKIVWFDAGNKLLFASDGGIFYSSDKGTTIRDRNTGLRIKQFYSCAIHPSTTNYFIAGAQDNGNHKFTNAGLSSTEEFIGGDGTFTAIDQDQPQFQFAAYVFNIYRKSTNGGTTWTTVNWSGSAGQFINPWDYDNTGNRIYGCWTAGNYFRWDDPTTGSASAVSVNVPAFNAALVSSVTVSPYTANQVYFGTVAGRVVKVTSANSATPTATNITGASMPVNANVSCVNTGTDDNNLIACFSNYGVASVWVSSDGGTNWTSLDNNGVNLPDMPVRWCMFYPGDNTRAILATETGIWETDLINGTSTVWVANTGFPTVRTDMLKYRSVDGTLAAATHGRGLWTNTINDMRTAAFRTKATGNYSGTGNWEFNTYGSVYLDARSIPSANNNVEVQSGHTLTLDASHVVNTGKTFTVNGTLNAGTNIISGAGAFSLPAGGTFATSNTGTNGISQNITVSGTKTFTDGANYVFNGATTAPFGSLFTTVRPNNLVVGANISLDKPTFVTGALGFSGSSRTLTTASNLTLVSASSGTARVHRLDRDFFLASATSGNSISGTATVERYIANPLHRSWHLLGAIAVTGTQTIKEAWQENGGPIVAGVGTLITSNLFNGSNGFDAVSNSASILTHNQAAAGSWNYNLANTNSTVLSSNQGYMLFVRGDRNYTTANAPTTSATVLRTNGTLTQGSLAPLIISTPGSGRKLVANPFASPIDMERIMAPGGVNRPNLDQNFMVWDPALTGNYGVGGFRAVVRTGVNHYNQTPVVLGGTISNDGTIQLIPSGSAFFMHASSTASLLFSEDVKATTPTTVYNPIVPTAGDQQLIANLMIVEPGNKESLADGIRVMYNDAYRSTIDDDIIKMGNFTENLSSYREGKKLIVEMRPMITANDTIFLQMSNTGIKDYRFQIGTIDFVQTGLSAYLEDTYLKTYKKLALDGSINNADFSVTAEAGSAAPDRFRIVFKTMEVQPPVYATGISIYPNPVTNHTVRVRITDMLPGLYQLRLVNNMGQTVLTRQLRYTWGSELNTLELGRRIAAGNYVLEILLPDKRRQQKTLLVAE